MTMKAALILFSLLPAVFGITYRPGTGTCEERCLDHYDLYNICQCTANCELFGDCCLDFFIHCVEPDVPEDSCEGQCGLFTPGKPCQCNSNCVTYGDCCEDYYYLCDDGADPNTSCKGRCTAGYQPEYDCQCNDQCPDFNNCCDDYESLCLGVVTVDPGLTCSGRCDAGYEPGKPCQCNDQCETYNNCCDDYEDYCTTDDFSCKDRCFIDYDSGLPCQCNKDCGKYGNCCPDYEDECFSNTTCMGRCFVEINSDLFCECEDGCDVRGTCCDDFFGECYGTCDGRCGLPYDGGEPCQCNDACLTHGDCCFDYNDVCFNGTGPDPIMDSDIANLAEYLWSIDVNRINSSEYVINKQGMADENNPIDRAPAPFFTSLNFNESVSTIPTFAAFIALLDNYIAKTGIAEVYNAQELAEIEAFLDAVFDTAVMNATTQFLINKGWHDEEAEFRAFVKEIWFGNYSRKESDPFDDSSGFEHVFVGEIKSDVTGFHNWLQFYLQEKEGSLNYYGYLSENTPNQIAAQFIWDSAEKEYGSMMVGASPEFELAMMSFCFRVKPGRVCTFTLEGSTTKIQTYEIRDAYIGSAYFVV